MGFLRQWLPIDTKACGVTGTKPKRGGMKLSRSERLLLVNQYLILEKLYPEDAEHYAQGRKALEEGYERHYAELTNNLYDGVSEECCQEIVDILDMFRSLQFYYEKLEDKSGIDEKLIQFPGFDGNDESVELRYVQYHLEDLGNYKELSESSHNVGFNSHEPLLDTYRSMLRTWKESKNKLKLSREEIFKLIQHL